MNEKQNSVECQLLIEQLTLHVNHYIKTKSDIKCLQEEGRKLRERLQYEEDQISSLMEQLRVQECISNNTCIKITSSKRSPTTSFKNILPLIQHVFKASQDQMNSFLEEVKRFKQDNCCNVKRVVCQPQKAPKVSTRIPKTPNNKRSLKKRLTPTVDQSALERGDELEDFGQSEDLEQVEDREHHQIQSQSLADALMSY